MIRRENTKAHLLPFQPTRAQPSPHASATPTILLTAGLLSPCSQEAMSTRLPGARSAVLLDKIGGR